MELNQNLTPEQKIEPFPTQPLSEEITPSEASPEEGGKRNIFKRFWFIFVALVLVLILSLAGLWFGRQQLMTPETAVVPSPTPLPSPTLTEEEEIAALEQQGISDEVEAIEEDLEATDFSDLDKELTNIDNELSTP